MQERIIKYKIPESVSDCTDIWNCNECDIMRDEFTRLRRCYNLQKLRYEILSRQSGNIKKMPYVSKAAKAFVDKHKRRQAS